MAGALALAAREEIRDSRLQARLLHWYASGMTFTLRDGPDPDAIHPTEGPFDERVGHTRLPEFIDRLNELGYAVETQARASPRLKSFMAGGGFPIYDEKSQAGFTLLDRAGNVLHRSLNPERVFADFDAVPDLITRTLLFVENRELLSAPGPRHNPAVEWDRFAGAVAALPLQVPPLKWLSLGGERAGGGSTLATQIEKYRHSPDGRTDGPTDKLRQMLSASLRAYREGEDTGDSRRRIVVDYLNTTPLSARAGLGEVRGLPDGLWAWFGIELDDAVAALAPDPANRTRVEGAGAGMGGDRVALLRRAAVYKRVLALILAQRRPSHLLIADREGLNRLANLHLPALANAGVIDPALRDAALAAPLTFRDRAPPVETVSFVERKATHALRARLMTALGLSSLYQLDRIDLTARSTLDQGAQSRVAAELARLADPARVREWGLSGSHMLTADAEGLSKIIYSFTLYERGRDANLLRVQADNLDQPLDINEGVKLDLGSTAKLRTLVAYLEIVADLHIRLAHLESKELRAIARERADPLTEWAADWLSGARDRSLEAMLRGAMERRYSASPRETFFTGGGDHTFANFGDQFDQARLSLGVALRHSVNLPFVRLMRDVTEHYMADGGDDVGQLLRNPEHPGRDAYLAQYADKEGADFLARFHRSYRGLTADGALERLADRVRPVPTRLAALFRAVRPDAPVDDMAAFLGRRLPQAEFDAETLARLYDHHAPNALSLNERAYVMRVHPLELWLVRYLQDHGNASRADVIAASGDARRQSYTWLFRARQAAQNSRIRIILEEEAFDRLHTVWAATGYPFSRLIPSLATAIGSSSDRPAALAELMGIILNDGVRSPTVRLDKLRFAADTPFETVVGLGPLEARRVMRPEVARVLREALLDVVENGTARRARGAFTDDRGRIIQVGGKTGTGDQRLDKYGPGGVVIESRATARTSTFAFFIGDRFYGVLTAFVHGGEAENYRFTSAVPVQILRHLEPALRPLISERTEAAELPDADLRR